MDRLPVEVFGLPVTELRRGFLSAIYFPRMANVLLHELPDQEVTMQYFQKQHSTVCGIDHAIAILKVATGHWSDQSKAYELFDRYLTAKRALKWWTPADTDKRLREMTTIAELEADLHGLWVPTWHDLDVEALYDGEEASPMETVMHVRGPLSQFGHLETPMLGVMARATRIASNVRAVVDVARGKPVLFFADRFDHYATQGADGYAAHIGGATGVASDAMAAWWGEYGLGTMPHALIAAYGGSTIEATRAFHKHYPHVNLIPLVDFDNDCVKTAMACAREFGDRLWGVRLDTSENMVDMSLMDDPKMGDYKPTGVNPALVVAVRHGLDAVDAEHTKIIVSGGFEPEKIDLFEDRGVPVGGYAVGNWFLRGKDRAYTADVVEPAVKRGRWLRPNDRLTPVE